MAAVGSFAVLGSLFGILTVFQLLELANPSQPLLRRLLVENAAAERRAARGVDENDAVVERFLSIHPRFHLQRLQDLLVGFLQRQRWFGAKARGVRAARFIDWGLLRRSPQPLFLTIVEVEFADAGRDRYFLPLTICSHTDAQHLADRAPHAVLANITGARKGVLFDAWVDDRFARTLLEAIEGSEQIRTRTGSIRASRTSRFAEVRGEGDLPPRRVATEQSNTSLIYGDQLILKLLEL